MARRGGRGGGGGNNPQRPRFELLKPRILSQDQGSVTIEYTLHHGGSPINDKPLVFTMRQGDKDVALVLPGDQKTGRIGHENGKLVQVIPVAADVKLASITATAAVEGSPSVTIHVWFDRPQSDPPSKLRFTGYNATATGVTVSVELAQGDQVVSGVRILFTRDGAAEPGSVITENGMAEFKIKIPPGTKAKIGAKAQIDGDPSDEIEVTLPKKESKPFRLKLDLIEKTTNTAMIVATVKQGADVMRDTQVTFYHDGSILPKVTPDADGVTTLNITVPEGTESCKILAKAWDIEGTPYDEIEVRFERKPAAVTQTNVQFDAKGTIDPEPSGTFRVVVTAKSGEEARTVKYEVVRKYQLNYITVREGSPAGTLLSTENLEVTGTQIVYVDFDRNQRQTTLGFIPNGLLSPVWVTLVR